MSLFRQPRPVLAVAFACVIAFMGIGLVDPILKPIADDLGAGPAQVSLLFTSYMAVMGLTMLVTGWVSSRLGAKRTLILGLAIIIIGAGLAGSMDSIGGIVGFRAVWGLGNALFIATALATIVASARGSVGQAIILYEAALGLGSAAGPLLGGALGGISWRYPFYGIVALVGGRPGQPGTVTSPSIARRAMSVRWCEPANSMRPTAAYARWRACSNVGPVPTTESTRPPADTRTPSSSRAVPAWSTYAVPSPASTVSPSSVSPSIGSPVRGAAG